jgi:ubiquinone/menaquinone biosynthesis C-methylase UbiE
VSENPAPFPAAMAWMLDNPLMRAHARGVLARLPLQPGMKVLDVGCGSGRLTIPVAQVAVDVLAVDVQRAMLDLVERRAAAAGLGNVRTLEAGAGTGALPSGGYDLALLMAVLGEVPADLRQAAIGEIAGALRTGGVLAVFESWLDPHRQSRLAVLEMGAAAGLVLEREDRSWLGRLLQLRKAD